MARKTLVVFLVIVLAFIFAVPAFAAGGRAGSTGVVYVSSQGLYYDTFVAVDPLPMKGPFQLLENGVTEFGPGDPGYLGGRWWEDLNHNGIQDTGETGLSGVRVVSARGLTATTDGFGRFHITCAITPREGRGSNFILKLDDRTLPSGFRSSTGQVRVQRATRGKALRFNFGASIHRVIGLDIADAVFEPGTADMRPQWKPRLNLLMEELQKGPAVLRLTYLADVEEAHLVNQRMDAMKKRIMQSWQALAGEQSHYPLTIEPEVFWRRGSPVKQASR